MAKSKGSVSAHYDSVAAQYHKQYQRENLQALDAYPANYFRLQILLRCIASGGLRRVYEVGVGEGTPLALIANMGVEVAGCDISDAMVAEARKTFRRHRLPPELIQWGDIEDSATLAAQLKGGRYDAVIAAGVLPHVRNDGHFLENVRMLLRPGGKALIEFRNKLFSLFTFNRHTKEFILDDLLPGVSDDVRTKVAAELDKRLAVELPPRRMTVKGKAPGYDAILSRFHNPFELTERFRQAGFGNIRLHWYHYHPAPPLLEKALGDAFRSEGMQLEQESSGWRGYFLCSAGVVEADLL